MSERETQRPDDHEPERDSEGAAFHLAQKDGGLLPQPEGAAWPNREAVASRRNRNGYLENGPRLERHRGPATHRHRMDPTDQGLWLP